MATKDEVMQAIEDERAEVQGRVDALSARISDLEAQVANGGTVTAQDLEEIREAVRNIHTAPSV